MSRGKSNKAKGKGKIKTQIVNCKLQIEKVKSRLRLVNQTTILHYNSISEDRHRGRQKRSAEVREKLKVKIEKEKTKSVTKFYKVIKTRLDNMGNPGGVELE